METIMKNISLISILTSLIVFTSPAQESLPSDESISTKLEEFQAKTGVVITGNYIDIGGIEGTQGTSVGVQATELRESNSQRKEYGVEVHVRGQNAKNAISYVDYDEIESLLKGLDFMAKAKSREGDARDLRATYRTKGGFAVSTFSDSTGRRMYVASGRSVSVSALFDTDKLIEVRTLFVIAKSALDKMRKK